MVDIDTLPRVNLQAITGHRLVNSKFPPISLFEDVVSEEEFEVMHKLESIVNPRLKAEIGDLDLLSPKDIPFGITGCSYAVAPFTHVNKAGSRFADGSYGVLYLADCLQTALAEVEYHQRIQWSNVPDLHFEVFVFRGLTGIFSAESIVDATSVPSNDGIYHRSDYTESQALGAQLKSSPHHGIQYCSVRKPGAQCWGLFTPKVVTSIIQSKHYEMLWDKGTLKTRIIKSP